MSYNIIWNYLKEARLPELFEAGCLDTCLIKMAFNRGWIDYDTAKVWWHVVTDC